MKTVKRNQKIYDMMLKYFIAIRTVYDIKYIMQSYYYTGVQGYVGYIKLNGKKVVVESVTSLVKINRWWLCDGYIVKGGSYEKLPRL